MAALAFHFLVVARSIIPNIVVMFRGGTEQVALIRKLTQRPRKSYKYHQIKKEDHYILFFQVNEPCDYCKLKSHAHKEFDEGIAKVELLS